MVAMKYLIVVLVVVIAVWLMLRDRKRQPPAQPRKGHGATPAAMVQCMHCGVHLPRSDATLDHRGAFCSEAHRLAGPAES